MDPNEEPSLEPNGWNPGRILLLGVGGLTVLLAVVTVWTVPRPTGDLYVALAAGRDILDGKLTTLDDWSFSTKGRVWVNQNWGTHLLYYLFYRGFGGRDGRETGGVPDGEDSGEIGLVVLKLLILLVGTTFLVLACHFRGVDWPIALIVTAGIIAAGRSFIDLRPNLTTLMFAPVMLYLLYRASVKPRRVWLVMVVFGVIWANLHGGFMLGLGTMGVWMVCMLLPGMLTQKLLRELLLGFVWGGAAGMVAWAFAVEGGLGDRAVLVAACIGVGAATLWMIHTLKRRFMAGATEKVKAEYRAALAAGIGPRWRFLAATLGAIFLAGVVTPFGIHQLFRDYSKMTMSFSELWNLTHPFVVMAGQAKDLWQSVIEWYSIFTASPHTFGTSWEFFGIVGLFGVLVPLHVMMKLVERRPVHLEDIVLIAMILVLAVVVVARAVPMWEEFKTIAEKCAKQPGRRHLLEGVLEQKWGWLAAIMSYSVIGLFAAAVGIAVIHHLFSGGRKLAGLSAAEIGVTAFDVFMIAFGVFYLALDARRFMPLSLILLAPVLARRVQWLLKSIGGVWPPAGRAWPTLVAGVIVFYVIALQARDNYMRYLPYSPRVRNKSMLRNMIVYRMFPPGCRDFLYDNQLEGRVFNEWRWEGYLRWYCPKLKMFIGGRAQQAYHVDTYKMQKRLLGGRELPVALEEMNVRWIVVPMNTGYNKLLTVAMDSNIANWVPVFCDGENIVLANSLLPECQRVIAQCAEGRVVIGRREPGMLTYRSKALAARSRGYCLGSRAFANRAVKAEIARRGRALTKEEEKRVREPIARRAIRALKASHQYPQDWPVFSAYAFVPRLYGIAAPKIAEEIKYFEAENERLGKMDYNRRGGVEILRCREYVLNTLVSLYGHAMSAGDAVKAQISFIAVCRATSDPGPRKGPSGFWLVQEQGFQILEVLAGKVQAGATFPVSYKYVPPDQKAIRKGERVIWLVGRGSGGRPVGRKAVSDTPQNRLAARKLLWARAELGKMGKEFTAISEKWR